MADPNPLDNFLTTETDADVVNALVASLESRLASPTHKETSNSITSSSANSNHVSVNDSLNACTNAPFNIKNTQLPNDSASRSNSVPNVKTIEKDNQILGINSIHSNASPGAVNSPVNVNRVVSPKPNDGINKVNAVRIVPQTVSNSPLAQSPVQSKTSTPSPSNVPHINSVHSQIVNVKKEFHPNAIKTNHGMKKEPSPIPQFVKQEVVNSHVKVENFVGNQTVNSNVKSVQPVLLPSNTQPLAQKTNVHIVHSANMTSVRAPAVNPSVITVRSQGPSQMTVVRPPIVTSHMNASSPRPPGMVRLQNRPGSAPIRIASSQPNIAPRPGGSVSFVFMHCAFLFTRL